MQNKETRRNPVATAWLAVGGLLALGVMVLIVREMPAVRREMRIMRM